MSEKPSLRGWNKCTWCGKFAARLVYHLIPPHWSDPEGEECDVLLCPKCEENYQVVQRRNAEEFERERMACGHG